MSDSLEITVGGIKCDACDYKDMSVKLEDYAEWVNKPCPDCGANLLTEADMLMVQTLIDTATAINSLDLPDDGERVDMEIKMNGSGTVNIVKDPHK